ncbi:MAG: peptidase [Candidatus Riflebacteria bacterium]|nr:peptidase [Candidatus Riflebacteria bacterium]
MRNKFTVIAVLIIAVLMICSGSNSIYAGELTADKGVNELSSIDLSSRCQDINKRIVRMAPVEMKVDISFLSESEKKAVKKLIMAAELINEIFFNQTFHLNNEYRAAIKNAKDLDPKFAEYFEIMAGPFDRIDNDEPFIGALTKPDTSNYYPVDMKKDELDAWLKDHPEDEKSFKSNFTVIARRDGKLVAIPYSEAYKKWLEPAAILLREAAELCGNDSLKKFLLSRADAFASNDYFQSDIDWMDVVGSPIDVTIGPYEVYEDKMFGYKAAFEAYITVVNPEESKKLQVYQKYLKELDEKLPMPEGAKWMREKYESPIRVVDVLATGGDSRKGVQSIAFNLPNDKKVRQAKGNKQVLLKNLMNAKFEGILRPIASEVLTEADVKNLSAEAFFLFVLQHELAHSLGPSTVTKEGKTEEVRTALKEKYSAIEEAKADTLSMLNTLYLLDKGEISKELEKTLLPTYLAGLFRTIRFGLEEAHGKGVMIQFDFLSENGAISYDSKTKTFMAHADKIRDNFRELARILLEIEANGDYAAASALIEKSGKPTSEVKEALSRLTHVPVDIKPVYPVIE